ncbi:hypothetical protein Ae201684P_002477 [Aphanomyces euteiches]|uniref:Uncharacterized protein n=1 Tax=Aphanomyces euteiches TaxID=100861 RepID=A0A6G0X202_9STRA|nr:hypothetical protein Ae201684_009450 [Aphanomyces euteiches]KAH9050853.1 hypothetical protein Ae201684P_020721 [Aphanomyces euteiches]KAH9070107.1 hypothetical protein Ae201684P_002477 [Aphanomyces euteiches]
MGNSCTGGALCDVSSPIPSTKIAKRNPPDAHPSTPRRSSVSIDTIRPMLAQSGDRSKLELLLVMFGDKNERCVIPRNEVRRMCKKHHKLKEKVNVVVRRLRVLNAILLDASPTDDGNTQWTIVNGEFDILREARGRVCRGGATRYR